MPERINNDDFEFDVLGDVLETLRFRGTIFFHSKLATPWGISLAPVGIPRFHIVLSGNCYVGVDNNGAVKVEEMDIVMLPGGHSHWIADQPDRELTHSKHAAEVCELSEYPFQQREITHRIMGGLVHFDQKAAHPILDSLPHIMHFPELKPTDPIWMTVTLIDAEMERTQNRGGPIVDRLTEVLFLQLLNRYVHEHEEATGFLAALRERRVHEALTLIHRELNFNWSLSSLGERIGMSRATLIRHFQDTVGVAPMTYITNWRIIKAYHLIKYSKMSLEQVAESVGYASARTLNKAVQRHYGSTPNELRRLPPH